MSMRCLYNCNCNATLNRRLHGPRVFLQSFTIWTPLGKQSNIMVLRRVIVQRVLILALTLSFGYVQGQDVVELEQEVHGKLMTTRRGNNISAYLGIPYAEPPIGPLRFKNPILWRRQNKQPIIAKKEPNQCPQINNDGVVVGDEDCLYLNVYTPKTYLDGPYPVMVYFHGGNFVRGSSKDAGPEYLLDKKIVLVTVNYRLGVLGFLSTGDAAAPGNFGLKDQVLALKWVKMNIINFGGQPDHVTIFGQDAGGVSTFLHALSPVSRDLFNQYISQSGNPSAFWTFAGDSDYKKYSAYLGDYLKCPRTDESFLLIECLRSFDPNTLVASDDIFNDNSLWRYRTWAPTIEPNYLEGAFITNGPMFILRTEGMKNCPAIIGNVLDEGLVLTAEFYVNNTIYDTITRDIYDFIKTFIVEYIDDNTPDKSTKMVQDNYFSGVDRTDKESVTRHMTDFMTDFGFEMPTTMMSNIMVQWLKKPFYMYTFEYRGTYSKSSDVIGNNNNVGVCHGDDLIYLFPTKNSTLQLSDSDEKMIDIMVDFWTSFAYTGTPKSQYISNPNIWKPFATNYEYLEIGKDSDPLDTRGNPEGNPRVFVWEAVIMGPIFEQKWNMNFS